MRTVYPILLIAIASLAPSLTACDRGPRQDTPPVKPAAGAGREAGTGAREAATGAPEWVPIYPGARVSGVETRPTGVETYTTFQLDAPTDCAKIFAWYDETLKVAGFDVVKSVSSSDGCSGIMRAEGPGHTRALNLDGGGAVGGSSRLGVQAVVRDVPGAGPAGAGQGSIPAWVPQYPGSRPANVVTSQEGPEPSADFSFTTTDDAHAVIGWYERALREARFTIVSSTVFDARTAKLTAQDATGRSIVNVRMEPAGGRAVVAIQARETR